VFESAGRSTPCTARRRAVIAGRALCLALATAVTPVLADDALADAVAREGERLLSEHVADPAGPGFSLLVARGDRVLYRAARGMASIELGVPLRPEHVFRIGSVTKQFSAAGLLKLVDDGKVALEDTLDKFLPDYPGAEAITIDQLLNHTSGIHSYTSIPGYMDQEIRRDLDTGELVAVFRDLPVDFAPGEKWQYNNSGYVLVGAVIEKASDMAWDRWLQQSMFEPLSLSNTHGGDTRALIAGQVSGYGVDADGSVKVAGPLSMSQPHAAGALLSNVDDLWRWNRALHGGQVLSADSYRRMTTPNGAAAADGRVYGYGIQRSTVRGRTAFEHGGGIHGFLSSLIYLPEHQISVAVLRNSTGSDGANVGLTARRLAAVAMGDPYPAFTPVELATEALESVQGIYRKDADDARILRVVDGVLTSQRSGGDTHPLTPVGDDRFTFAQSLSWFRIERGADGAPAAMRFFQAGEGEGELWPLSDEPLVTRASLDLPQAALTRLVGSYSSAQLGLKVFFDDESVLRVQVPGQPAFRLHAESPSRMYITEVDASFEFAPLDGPVESVTLTQGPMRIEMARAD
jgi:D-alanyl-D-alanine carboxypeptidase